MFDLRRATNTPGRCVQTGSRARRGGSSLMLYVMQ
jgi:hypothetical protein